jgi:hypothetical protein
MLWYLVLLVRELISFYEDTDSARISQVSVTIRHLMRSQFRCEICSI